MLPDNALKEFANTFKEWHYLTGGTGALAVAVLAGVFVLVWRYLTVLEHRAKNNV